LIRKFWCGISKKAIEKPSQWEIFPVGKNSVGIPQNGLSQFFNSQSVILYDAKNMESILLNLKFQVFFREILTVRIGYLVALGI